MMTRLALVARHAVLQSIPSIERVAHHRCMRNKPRIVFAGAEDLRRSSAEMRAGRLPQRTG
jgi:hypothetical protein